VTLPNYDKGVTQTRADRKTFDDLDLASFQRHVLDWYGAYRRDLPWREDPDPYHILVSEVMLQQTGVQRVIPAYHRFLRAFPTLRSLADASPANVLRSWHGLGYNRRAINLKRAAEVVGTTCGGSLPTGVLELELLPGIGRYTSRAVACFAFDVQVAVVDTNVRRVLSAFADCRLSEKETEELAERLLPEGRASDWNQALMDYGALASRGRARRTNKISEPFASTNRFWRGRIVDALCRHPALSVPALLSELPYPEKNEQRVRGLVLALHEEGLVEYDRGQDSVSLPA